MTELSTAQADTESDPVYVAAADWLIRVQGAEVSIEETLAWQRWLAASPKHARAYAQIEELSQIIRSVSVPGIVSARQMAVDRYDASVSLKQWKATQATRRFWTVLAVAASLVSVALGAAFWAASPSTQIVATAVGENRNITLSDGSKIALGGDTRIEVMLSKHVRAIDLKRGEALFTVAKDASRPFRVRAGAATIVAVGTAFDVQRDSDRAVVWVSEGRVVVEPVTDFLPVSVLREFRPKLRPVHVAAGEQTTAGSAGIEDPVKVTDPAAATLWQSGRLAFRLQPLHYVLEEVNRYAPKPIVLQDDELAELTITGTVERDNITGWVRSLERAFDLQAAEEPERIVIRRQGAGS